MNYYKLFLLLSIYINSDEKESKFEELYKKYYKKIYNYIMRNTLNKEAAEDITANTFFKVVKYINKNADSKIDNFSAWIYKIASNELIKYLHKHRLSKVELNLANNDDINDIIENSGEKENFMEKFTEFFTIKQAMLGLKPDEKLIIDMYYFEHKKYSEISEILNIKENTLRPMMSRAVKKLKQLVEK